MHHIRFSFNGLVILIVVINENHNRNQCFTVRNVTLRLTSRFKMLNLISIWFIMNYALEQSVY